MVLFLYLKFRLASHIAICTQNCTHRKRIDFTSTMHLKKTYWQRSLTMKTREEIYEKEGAALLRILSTYHTLTYEQVIRTFDEKTRNDSKSCLQSGKAETDFLRF